MQRLNSNIFILDTPFLGSLPTPFPSQQLRLSMGRSRSRVIEVSGAARPGDTITRLQPAGMWAGSWQNPSCWLPPVGLGGEPDRPPAGPAPGPTTEPSLSLMLSVLVLRRQHCLSRASLSRKTPLLVVKWVHWKCYNSRFFSECCMGQASLIRGCEG